MTPCQVAPMASESSHLGASLTCKGFLFLTQVQSPDLTPKASEHWVLTSPSWIRTRGCCQKPGAPTRCPHRPFHRGPAERPCLSAFAQAVLCA